MNRDAELAGGYLGTVLELEDAELVQLVDHDPGFLGRGHRLVAAHLGTDGVDGAVEGLVDVAGKHLRGGVTIVAMQALRHHGAQHGLQRGIHVGVDAEQTDGLPLAITNDGGERAQRLAGGALGHVGAGDILPALEFHHRQVGDGGTNAAPRDMAVGNLDDRRIARI